uniref:adenylate kinase n=1 Tax=Davidia involucrata TaxID=16924 RepID=A0A5B6Z091_DAVIN
MENIAHYTATKEEAVIPKEDATDDCSNEAAVIFVLGGPACGKGSQCSKIAAHFEFRHLSVGDLLQEEIDSGSENGAMIQDFKKEGKLVPSDVVVKVVQRAMQGSKNKKFLIDGFPRNIENLAAAENIMKIDPDFVLFFDCSEEEMIRRSLNRNQGRADDNIETMRKRLKVFVECTLPVINYYRLKEKVERIDGERPMEEVFEVVKSIFSKFKWDVGRA